MSFTEPTLLAYAFVALGPAINALALTFLGVFALLGVGLLLYLASLPGRIATRRGHPRAEAVKVGGWLGLPTGIGWVAAMVWAFAQPAGSTGDAPPESLAARIASLEKTVTDLERNMGGER